MLRKIITENPTADYIHSTTWFTDTTRSIRCRCRMSPPHLSPYILYEYSKSGMNPKTLQYLMRHSDIGVTMNVYTHLGLDDAKDEMIRMEELEQAKKEVQGRRTRPRFHRRWSK